MKNAKVDYLFFGAHPDDAEIGCGGTMLDSVANGKKIGLVDLTRGEMGTRGTAETRLRESLAAARVLGALFRVQLDLGDGNLRTGREEELDVISVIRKHRPSIVFAPFPDDRHPDHTRAGQLVTEASFYAGLAKIDTDQAPHRPQTVVYYMQNYVNQPTFVVDTTAQQKTKMDALRCYKSQFYNPKSKERMTAIAKKSFIDMIEARARHFGAMIGAEFGEGFVTKLPPRVDDVTAAFRGREV
ncbi:MAG: bacillithiol biosynthesis deacetylase BshB1 [Acidobacteria bacterium]|nr:bacillithiol biosynthesis deacetylase BshB1 [Acidobacteriota bacterium]